MQRKILHRLHTPITFLQPTATNFGASAIGSLVQGADRSAQESISDAERERLAAGRRGPPSPCQFFLKNPPVIPPAHSDLPATRHDCIQSGWRVCYRSAGIERGDFESLRPRPEHKRNRMEPPGVDTLKGVDTYVNVPVAQDVTSFRTQGRRCECVGPWDRLSLRRPPTTRA